MSRAPTIEERLANVEATVAGMIAERTGQPPTTAVHRLSITYNPATRTARTEIPHDEATARELYLALGDELARTYPAQRRKA